MKRQFLVLTCSVVLFSCGYDSADNTNEKAGWNNTSANTQDSNQYSITGCYLRVLERDSLFASLNQSGNTVTGELVFDNYEKDGSHGTVSGKIEDGILKLVYRFQSEGMSSIAQQYFKLAGNGIIQGIGEVAVKGDSVYFVNDNNISYADKDLLQKIPCDKLRR